MSGIIPGVRVWHLGESLKRKGKKVPTEDRRTKQLTIVSFMDDFLVCQVLTCSLFICASTQPFQVSKLSSVSRGRDGGS